MKKVDKEKLEKQVREGISLENSDFRGCDLTGVNLSGAKLSGSNFRYANLTGADLSNAIMENCNLRHAMLIKTNLKNAVLTGSDLSHAKMKGAIVVGTVLKNTKMSGVTGISNRVFFRNETVEKLVDSGKAELKGNGIFIKKENRLYNLTEAFRIIDIIEGNDENSLLGRVKTAQELKEIGAEIMPDSILVGETVYRVENGFLGQASESEKEKAIPEKEKSETSDVDMLIEYFLKMEGN